MKSIFTSQKRRSLLYLALLTAALCALSIAIWRTVPADPDQELLKRQEGLVINEVCAANPGTPTEQGGTTYEDYIELYNAGTEPVSLAGLYLSDDEKEPLKWQLPEAELLEAGERCVIYASGEEDGEETAPFKLKGGEILVLSRENLALDAVMLPSLTGGVAYARETDGSGAFCKMRPSPGETNDGIEKVLEKPVISVESGFYEEAFQVELLGEKGTRIYYTLDGSVPTEESRLYEEPISIEASAVEEQQPVPYRTIVAEGTIWEQSAEPLDRAVVLRAVAIDEEGNRSNAATASYFLNYGKKEGYEDVKILSMVVEPSDLFDPDTGIYVRGTGYEEAMRNGEIGASSNWAELINYTNYNWRGRSAERQAHFDFFDTEKNVTASLDGGIRIRGNQSRSFPQKSFNLYSREAYETDTFPAAFFGTDMETSSLILTGAYTPAKVLVERLAAERSAGTQRYEPCQVFINGTYWGMYYLMEKYDSDFMEYYYGIPREKLLLIEATRQVAEGNPEDKQLFKDLRNFLETDLSGAEAYDQLLEQMDMQSFIDWMCTSIYVGNTDTKPLGGNVYTWKCLENIGRGYQDGRWRWMLYDTDDSFGVGMDASEDRPAYAIDSFVEHPGYSPSGFLEDAPMPNLMENEEFCRQFVLTFQDMVNDTFRPERIFQILDEEFVQASAWMEKSQARWQSNYLITDSYEEEMAFFREYFQERPAYMLAYLAEHFGLEGQLVPVTVSFEAAKGSVQLNTITPEPEDGVWTGQYYTDVPLTVTAEPAEGYVFSHWEIAGGALTEGTLQDAAVQVQPDAEGLRLRAVFVSEKE